MEVLTKQQRFISILTTEMAVENLKLQARLETIINGEGDIDSTLFQAKDILKEITLNEAALNKFNQLIQPNTPPQTTPDA